MSIQNEAADNEAELAAYQETVRIMLGFRTIAEVEDAFRRPLVQAAVKTLEHALTQTRQRGQPDEFALAAAVEAVLIAQAQGSLNDLDVQKIFNDPTHHELPSEALEALSNKLWQPLGAETD
jgi:hypothetical protein